MNFNPNFCNFLYDNLLQGKSEIAENMKIILYKAQPHLFELMDFDNDDSFLDPALFEIATANRINDSALVLQNIYGFIPDENKPKKINITSDKYGNIYIPNIGWLTQLEKNRTFVLEKTANAYILDGKDVQFEPLAIHNKLNVELLKYRLELFDDRYYDSSHNIIDVDVDESYRAQNHTLNNSLNYVADNIDWLAKLIKIGCPKAVLFNDGTHPMNESFCARNSFASFQVKRISFHNIYQPWYDEVFFLDDISHQMGHVLLDQITFDKTRFFKIDHTQNITANSEFGKRYDRIESRNYEIVFHSLFTFFVILNVMDSCMSSNAFNAEQKSEIKGRIAFYLRKSMLDFELFEDFDKNEYAETIYTPEGLYIYMSMKQSFMSVYQKYKVYYEEYHMSNQTYNYNHKKFLEFNKFEVAG